MESDHAECTGDELDHLGLVGQAVVVEVLAAPFGEVSANALGNIDGELFRLRLRAASGGGGGVSTMAVHFIAPVQASRPWRGIGCLY
jgi:hypothetical protein